VNTAEGHSKPVTRLGWLDAVRGVAAISVVFQHLGSTMLRKTFADVHTHFDLGIYGVMTFFLVSGYIVPASLERRGDVRAFWIGRLFRLYPLCLAVFVGTVVLLGPFHAGGVDGTVYSMPLLSSLANATMLQDLIGVHNGLAVMWTLTYEMIFYYLVTALFVLGWQRRSASIAMALGVAGLLLGPVLPMSYLLHRTGPAELTACTLVALALGLTGLLSGRKLPTRAAALLLGCYALVLVFMNSRSTGYETLLILATMFSGTAIYRAEQRQIRRGWALTAVGTVLVCGVAVAAVYNTGADAGHTWTYGPQSWYLAFAAAWLTFGAAMLLRNRRMPAALCWLGRISYSTYLVHVPLIAAMWLVIHHTAVPHSTLRQLAWMIGFFAVLLTVSQLTYRYVELPMQNLGRRVARRGRDNRPPADGAKAPVRLEAEAEAAALTRA
jgi:peptidoglycan/LPS O-acetylase OafA/YrhL